MISGARITLLLVTAVVTLGCDPGVRYLPRQWVAERPHRWKFENEDFRAVMFAPGNLIGAKSMTPEPEVENLRDQPLVFERATISTGEKTYVGHFGAGNRVDVRTVGVGEIKRVPMYFNFDQPIADALGNRFLMLISYRVGDGDSNELMFEFAR
jgi:hypothetical protein